MPTVVWTTIQRKAYEGGHLRIIEEGREQTAEVRQVTLAHGRVMIDTVWSAMRTQPDGPWNYFAGSMSIDLSLGGDPQVEDGVLVAAIPSMGPIRLYPNGHPECVPRNEVRNLPSDWARTKTAASR